MELDKIYNIDCLEGMKSIPDKSIDCIICDLPYGVLNKKSEGGTWDSVIPFDPLWKEYERIRTEREKQQMSALINKYDQTLTLGERENQKLKMRLKELQGYFA